MIRPRRVRASPRRAPAGGEQSPFDSGQGREQADEQVAGVTAGGRRKRPQGAAIVPQAVDDEIVGRRAGVHPADGGLAAQPSQVVQLQEHSRRKATKGLIVGGFEGERSVAGHEGAAERDRPTVDLKPVARSRPRSNAATAARVKKRRSASRQARAVPARPFQPSASNRRNAPIQARTSPPGGSTVYSRRPVSARRRCLRSRVPPRASATGPPAGPSRLRHRAATWPATTVPA